MSFSPAISTSAISCATRACAVVLAITILTGNAGAVGTVHPNSTLVLRSASDANPPDGTGEDCFSYLLGVCQTDQTGDRIGARTATALPFERSKATVFTYYDFKVDDKDGEFDTVLNAQVSGAGEFNGFLALVAGGSASGSISVQLIDLGPFDLVGTVEEKVVAKQVLSAHEILGKVTTGINFGIKIEAGAPYVGAGASPELKFNVQLQKKVIRDSLNFGLQALVQRGHKYRLKFVLSSAAKRGGTTGVGISQFKLGGPVTDMLDTENWLQGVRETILASLPNLKPESMKIKEGLGWLRSKRMIEAELVDGNGNSTTLGGTAQFLQERAAAAGLPTSFEDIVAKRFRQAIPDAVEEGIDRPGFTLDSLTVMLESDSVEIAADQTDRINEAIRLLLTPQGQRSTDYIDCAGPGNSGSNGNNNGNGNGVGNSDGCNYPANASGDNSQSSNSSGQFGSVNAFQASESGTDINQSGGGAIGWLTMLGIAAAVSLRRRSSAFIS